MVEEKESVKEVDQSVADAEDQGDIFQLIMAIMIAVVSLTGAIIAWQVTLAEPDDADRVGLQATLNGEIVRFVNSAVLYKNYRTYTTYTLNNEFQHQLDIDLAAPPANEQAILQSQRLETTNVIGLNRLFFPQRYLNRDGSYNTQRQLGEAWAQASQQVDLNAQTHFDEADKERTKISLLIGTIIGVTIALVFFTLAEGLHPIRRSLRILTALSGIIFLVGSVAGVFIIKSLL